jgi:hypothetical protein
MLFVAKLIIHGGDVRLGPLADVADGGSTEPVLRKYLTRTLGHQPLRGRLMMADAWVCFSPQVSH